MGFLSSLAEYDHDIVEHGHKYMKDEIYIKKTGWEGVKGILLHDKLGHPSPQLSLIVDGVLSSTMIGVLIGGGIHASDAKRTFLRQNQATRYDNPHIARRALYDRCILSFSKGAWMWGWRLGVFSSTFLLLNAAIPAYRGQYSFMDWTAGSAISGGIYKFKHGPKPMMAGILLGAALGTAAGGALTGLLKLTGLTMDDIYDVHRANALKAFSKKYEHIENKRDEMPNEAPPMF